MIKLTLLTALLLAWSSVLHAAEPLTIDLAKLTWQGIPGLERTAKGRIFASWFTGGPKEPAPENTVLLSHSDDAGKTFTPPKAMALANADGTRSFDPCLWIDPKGVLWYFFNRGNKDKAEHGVYARTCADPDAATPVWGAEFRVGFDVPYSFRMNKPTVLSSGEWVLPVTLATEPIHEWVCLDRTRHGVAISKDGGKSWALHGALTAPGFALENMIIERRDQSLWMLIRTSQNVLWQSFSTNRGRTWSVAVASTIKNPSSRFFIRRLASGNLLLVNHHKFTSPTHRHRLTAQISTDDGATWCDGLLLDERSNVSYPDGVQDRDGMIWITYDHDRQGAGEILYTAFREEDVIAGKDVSGSVKLRQIISRLDKPGAGTPLPRDLPASIRPDPRWTEQAAADVKQDFTSIPYDGISPNKLVCDTTLRELPDGSWALFMLAGDDFEPSAKNYTGLTRSFDKGKTWTSLQAVDIGLPREGKTMGQGPTELMTIGKRSTLFFSTHSQTWGRDWQSWFIHSDDNCKTWSPPQPVPGRMAKFTFIRNHIVTHDGRILLPFQHYEGPPAGTPPPPPEEKPWHRALVHYVSNPRNGVLISNDGGKTWTENGNIRLTPDVSYHGTAQNTAGYLALANNNAAGYHGWAENNIAELGDGRIAMIIRADRLGSVLYYAESKDGGKTWPEFAVKTDIPNPGSKATLYPLGGNTVALLHNPNPKGRYPLALWISFDGMKTWPYQRVLVEHSCDGPGRAMNYPDGFVSKDKQWLHFAYDDNRHRAVHYSAKLPPLP